MEADSLPSEPLGKHTIEYYSAVKKDEIMPLVAVWMDLEIIILSEINQTESYIILLICRIKKKSDANELIYKWTHRLKEQIYGYQGGWVGRRD